MEPSSDAARTGHGRTGREGTFAGARAGPRRPRGPRSTWTRVYPGRATAEGEALTDADEHDFPGDWPPGLLVLLWPELFAGDDGIEQLQIEVAVMAMADAGLISVYLARGWDCFLFGRLRLLSEQGRVGGSEQPDAGTPWLWQEILAAIERHESTWFGYRLHQLRDQTRLAARSRGIINDDHRRRFLGSVNVNAELRAASEVAARALAQRWTKFVKTHPALHEELVQATRTHEAAIG